MKKGFTLVELLVVIAIIGVLAAAILVAINPAERIAEARDSQTKNDIGAIATGLTTYFTRNGYYPDALSALAQPTGDLKALPTAPVDGPDEGGAVRTYNNGYAAYPAGGLESANTEARSYWQMTGTTNGAVAGAANNGVWCFQSATGAAGKLVLASLANCDGDAADSPEPTP